MQTASISRLLAPLFLAAGVGFAIATDDGVRDDAFRQLDESLPTPNDYRTASGAPGHEYWQQRVDYDIQVEIDDERQHITGSETITYVNESPDTLRYLWVQVDPNIFAPDSHSAMVETAPDFEDASFRSIGRVLARSTFDGGAEITRVVDAAGQPLHHVVNDTMMRIDLAEPLRPANATRFTIDWNYAIIDAKAIRARGGYEYFEEDGNYIYEMAQWFPRLCAYTDVDGWQNKQFLGRGEFTLEFGNYRVAITVPDDHVVASTGVLQNPEDVLTAAQRERLEGARDADTPVFIVTPEEAEENEGSTPSGTKTWIYQAENVRDFAFASSRKFIWDAVEHQVEGGIPVMAMSYYPNEGEPLWSRYSTHSIVHTLDVYSKFTFPYPYPVAISVNGPVGGMEYPMICFNGPRPEADGTYTSRTKYGLISVIIHEVGHNWFPMIVNSDERQWTWMDEGLNTFVQYLAEQEWEEGYPSWRGEAHKIVDYMASEDQVPIMTNSESILQFGANAYAKPATALNVLRETVMGRELFDFAFKEYANRWAFRRPQPADLFRTLEDASAVDLDWFWRAWFYTTDHVDLGITNVRRFNIDTQDPELESSIARAERDAFPETVSERLNRDLPKRAERYPELLDFYNEFDELDVTPKDRRAYAQLLERLEDDERAILEFDQNFYVVDVENLGGIVMPVILEVHFTDGSVEELRIPAELWTRDDEHVSRLILTPKEIEHIVLDPHLETADTDLSNNRFPQGIGSERFEISSEPDRPNPMQEAREPVEIEASAPTGSGQ